MKKVLFVCSANVFRSLAAELAVRRELGETSSVQVSSGGVFFKRIKPLREDVRSTLNVHGLDPRMRTHLERLLPRFLQMSALLFRWGWITKRHYRRDSEQAACYLMSWRLVKPHQLKT